MSAKEIYQKFRVWWIPQIPMKPFTVDVESVKQGQFLCDVLAKYDLFQLENNIKPDYANAGGIQGFDGQEWTDLDDAEIEELKA
jgi:hypothetical protein